MGTLVRNGLNSSMDIESKYQVNICPKLIIEEAITTRVNVINDETRVNVINDETRVNVINDETRVNVINDETSTILKNFWQSLYHTLFATVASCLYLVLPPQSLTKQ